MTKKYLVVDDNDLIRNLLCFLFSDNTDILTAQDGQEALDLAKAHSFDIILTDYNMPVMNGIKFLEQAREIDSDTYLHSILLTGSIDDEVRSFSERNGIPLIPKPFSATKLRETVNTLCEKNSGKHVDDKRGLPAETVSPRSSFNRLRPGSYSQVWG